MKIEGEHTLPVSRERLWALLMDPDVLAAAMPGCERLEMTEEGVYQGVVEARLGPVQSTFTTTFTVADRDYPEGYRLHVEGDGTGGFVRADVRIMLAPDGDHGTRMHHEGEAAIGGKLARVGQRMVQAGARAMIEQGFSDLHARIERELGAPAGDGGTGSLRNALGAFWRAFRHALAALGQRLRGRGAARAGTTNHPDTRREA